MKYFRVICFVALQMHVMTQAMAADAGYSDLVSGVKDMPLQGIYAKAEKFFSEGRNEDALVLYAVICGRYRDDMSDDDKNLCALSHKQAGMVYYNRGDYVNALDEFIRGVKVSEQCASPKYIARLYNNIGNVYGLFLEYEKGIDYYLKACYFSRKMADRDLEHDILVNLTGLYTFTGDMANARKFYSMSEKLKDNRDSVDVYMSGYTLSLIQIYEGQTSEAIPRLKKLAHYVVEKRMEPKFLCFAYQEIYNAYAKQGEADSTLRYLKMCDETARLHNIQRNFTSTLKSLSEFYQKEGDMVKSVMYWSRYQAIMDSIYNMREFAVVRNSLFSYEVGKTVKEVDELRERDENNARTIRIQRLTMGAVAGGMLVLAFFLVIVVRQKRKLDSSYADLYMVNCNFIDSQGRLTARLRRETERLKEKDSEIAMLKEQLGRKDVGAELSAETPKYLTSSLTEEQSLALAEQIQDVMENTTEFCNCEFSLGALAELVGSNKKYVSQVINDVFHKSFNDYVTPYRIHLACVRFSDKAQYGNLTMKAIAESVGFKSYTSFVNAFRKITGITPSLYQKMAACNAD